MGIRVLNDDGDQKVIIIKDEDHNKPSSSGSLMDTLRQRIQEGKELEELLKPKKKEDDGKPKAKTYTQRDVLCISLLLTMGMFWTGPFIWVAMLNTLHTYAGLVSNVAK